MLTDGWTPMLSVPHASQVSLVRQHAAFGIGSSLGLIRPNRMRSGRNGPLTWPSLPGTHIIPCKRVPTRVGRATTQHLKESALPGRSSMDPPSGFRFNAALAARYLKNSGTDREKAR